MKKLIVLMLVIMIIPFTNVLNAQIERFQTTFIYTFARSIQWPNFENDKEFVIGVIGNNHPLTKELEATKGNRTTAGRPIKLVEFSSIDNIGECHILFVPNNRLRHLKDISDKVKNTSTLIVTEAQGRNPNGSVINLYVEDERMRFSLDEDLARDKKLLVSTQLRNYSKN